MAFGKTLAHRFFNAAKSSSAGTLLPPSLRAAEPSSYLRRLLPDSSEERGLFRRFLQWRALFQSAKRLPLPVGDGLADRIRQLNRERLRLEGLVSPPRSPPEAKREEEERISVEEARKMLRAAQMEAARDRLRAIQRSCVAYAEFAQICCDVPSLTAFPSPRSAPPPDVVPLPWTPLPLSHARKPPTPPVVTPPLPPSPTAFPFPHPAPHSPPPDVVPLPSPSPPRSRPPHPRHRCPPPPPQPPTAFPYPSGRGTPTVAPPTRRCPPPPLPSPLLSLPFPQHILKYPPFPFSRPLFFSSSSDLSLTRWRCIGFVSPTGFSMTAGFINSGACIVSSG